MMRARVAQRWLDAALDSNKMYYHGTSTEKAGKAILRAGIEPPDLTTRSGPFRPVAGKVYLTPHLAYAMLYCLGGELAEAFLQGRTEFPERTWGGSEWGYLFAVPGTALTKVHPDEDSIGEMLADGSAPAWLQSMAKRILRNTHPEIRPGAQDSFYIPDFFEPSEWVEFQRQNLYDLATQSDFFQIQAQAVAGKILLREMTVDQQMDLIAAGAHVANEGKVIPTACWKFHKSKTPLLKRDGSNFFQIAERCG